LDPASELGKLWALPDAPDYAQFVEPAAKYFKQYLEALAAWKGVRRGDRKGSRDVWTRQVMASWGLLARGIESLPFALQLIHSDDQDAREQGASLLGSLGKDPSISDELINMLESEPDDVARDSAIIALGQMKSKRALPTLEKILRDTTADGDTRWTAGESVGRIVRRRFGKSGGSVTDEAIAWLDAHPHWHRP
jgi:HEAT repeat protein